MYYVMCYIVWNDQTTNFKTKQSLLIIQGLVGLITGAAEGLGKAAAENFLKQGARLSLVDKKERTCPETLTENEDNILFHSIDILDDSEVEKVFSATQEKFGRLDFSVHCMETSYAAMVYNFVKDRGHPEIYSNLIELLQYNTVSTFNFCRHSARIMCKNKPNKEGQRGCIINTSNTAATEGLHGQSLYAASKAAINSMTLPLARDLASQGVRVNTIQIGHMEIPLHNIVGKIRQKSFFISQIPFPKRYGDPDEYVHLLHTILENPLINGEIIRLDGGLRFPHLHWTRL